MLWNMVKQVLYDFNWVAIPLRLKTSRFTKSA